MQLPTLDEPPRIKAKPDVTTWLEAARSGVVSRIDGLFSAAPEEARQLLLSATDSSGFSALHWSVTRDHHGAVAWLIAAGANVDAKTTAGYTALIIAAHRGYETIVDALLAAGASALPVDKSGLTSLHHAAASASKAVLSRLVAAGASLTRASALKNRDNSTPLGIAARIAATASGRQQLQAAASLKFIEEESKRLKGWFRAARVADVITLGTMLIRSMDDSPVVNMTDGGGLTALISCVRCGRPDAVRLLLDHGADAAHVDGAGSSVLHHLAAVSAARHGLLSELEMLLAAGARPLARDGGGKTVLQVVEEAQSRALSSARTTFINGPFITRLNEAARLAQCMRLWRAVGRVAGKLATWHARAVERAYAPGGIGYLQVEADFGERASKSQRTS